MANGRTPPPPPGGFGGRPPPGPPSNSPPPPPPPGFCHPVYVDLITCVVFFKGGYDNGYSNGYAEPQQEEVETVSPLLAQLRGAKLTKVEEEERNNEPPAPSGPSLLETLSKAMTERRQNMQETTEDGDDNWSDEENWQ